MSARVWGALDSWAHTVVIWPSTYMSSAGVRRHRTGLSWVCDRFDRSLGLYDPYQEPQP